MRTPIFACYLACFAGFAFGQAVPEGAGPGATDKSRAVGVLVERILESKGFPTAVAPARPRARAGAETASTDAPAPPVDRPQVRGLIVRFDSRAIQALAAANQAPPAEAIAAIREAAGHPLLYHRAMSGGMHVFRFEQPLEFAIADAIVQRLRALDIVELAEPDLIARRQAVSADPDYGSQWNLRGPAQGFAGGIEAEAAWDVTTGSRDVVVAVVDSGILAHPEFGDRIVAGYDFIADAQFANDGNGRDADATDPGDHVVQWECGVGEPSRNSSWHGTLMAGIVAADGANGIGIAGVAWRTVIQPVRVLGKCGGAASDIVDAIRWAAGLSVPSAPANATPAQVINLSLSFYSPGGCPAAYQDAIDAAVGQGALVVAASGNQAEDAADYAPGNCRGVLTAIAIDPFGEYATYTNDDTTGRIAAPIGAPGGDIDWYGPDAGILSTSGSGTREAESMTWALLQGTSVAAAHVSGVAALALAVDPHAAGIELASILRLAANPFPANTYCAKNGVCGDGIASAAGGVDAAGFLAGYRLVYEFYNGDLNHYFRTAAKSEAAGINRGLAGAGWSDTLDYFYAWADPVDGALPVCRFYGTPGIGPNSHFYTASAEECALVKQDPGWTYEGIAFYAKLPEAGVCPAGSVTVYRAYNMRWMVNDSNHRFTTDPDAYAALVAQGWAGEGAALCAAF